MLLHCFGRKLNTSKGKREALFSGKFISLGEAPLRKPEKPAALRNGFERRLKNTIEESDQGLPVIRGVGQVVLKRGSADVFCVKFRGVIHMQDVFSQFMVGGEIVPADKTFRIEKLLYPRVSPVNGNCVHMEGVDQLFCTPTRSAGVFECQVEAVVSEPINFYLVAVTWR